MNTNETILARKSIRNFTDKEISDEEVKTFLRAGMSGPTGVNARDWHFIVIRNKDTLVKMADLIGKSADPLRNATLAVLLCGDTERSLPSYEDYWIVDCAIAAQNIMLSAYELGIGSVYLGIWPKEKRMESISSLFNIDEDTALPHSVIAMGVATDEEAAALRDKPDFESSQVHFEKW